MPLVTSSEFTKKLGPDSILRAGGAPDLVGKLRTALDAYHADNSGVSGKLAYWFTSAQAWADARLKALDDAEHLLYQILDRDRVALVAAKADRVLLMQMLADLQEAHQGVIDYVHRNNLVLFVPDRAELGKPAAGQLDADWNALRNGTGAVSLFTGTDADRGNREVRAIHARLLSRPEGRKLLRSILSVQDGQTWPVAHQLMPAFTLSAVFRERVLQNKGRLAELGKELVSVDAECEAVDQKYRALLTERTERTGEPPNVATKVLMAESRDFATLSAERDRLDRRYDEIRDEIPKYGDEAIDDHYITGEPQPGVASKNVGSGPGSTVKLRCGLRDNALRNYAGSGDDKTPVPAPAFIVYGHELVHVVQQRFPAMWVLTMKKYDMDHPKRDYSDSIEHETIRELKKVRDPVKHIPFYENALRAEHRITTRKYHTATSAFELDETD